MVEQLLTSFLDWLFTQAPNLVIAVLALWWAKNIIETMLQKGMQQQDKMLELVDKYASAIEKVNEVVQAQNGQDNRDG